MMRNFLQLPLTDPYPDILYPLDKKHSTAMSKSHILYLPTPCYLEIKHPVISLLMFTYT